MEGVPDCVRTGAEGKGTGGNSPLLRFYRGATATQLIGIVIVDTFLGIEHYPGEPNFLLN